MEVSQIAWILKFHRNRLSVRNIKLKHMKEHRLSMIEDVLITALRIFEAQIKKELAYARKAIQRFVWEILYKNQFLS